MDHSVTPYGNAWLVFIFMNIVCALLIWPLFNWILKGQEGTTKVALIVVPFALGLAVCFASYQPYGISGSQLAFIFLAYPFTAGWAICGSISLVRMFVASRR